MLGRRSKPAEGMAPPADQAAWDADGRSRSSRRMVVLAVLGLAALLLVGALLVARGGDDGDMVALGPADATTTLPPLADSLTGEIVGPDGLPLLAPGDTVPGGGPGVDPGAVSADGTPVTAGTGAAAGGTGGGATGGGGVPTPTTGVRNSAGGTAATNPTNTTVGTPATTATTTQTPTTPAPPGPVCTISAVQLSPSTVARQGNDLERSVQVTFRADNCAGTFQVRVNTMTRTASGTLPNLSATIPAESPGPDARWRAATYQVEVSGGGAAKVVVNLTVTN
jgi:hypothetical protein